MPFTTRVKAIWLSAAAVGLAGAAIAQDPAPKQKAAAAKSAPAAKSGIDGSILHAQVLLDRAGFGPGPIDGKTGVSLEDAIRGFQISRGLKPTALLDTPTRQALLQDRAPSTRMLRVSPDDMAGPFVMPFPEGAEEQAKLKLLAYRTPIEKMAEKFHTTPQALAAMNDPNAQLKTGAILRFPNVLPSSRNYPGLKPEHARLMSDLNVDGNQPQGDRIVVDKSERVLQVWNGEKLVGQFPVTMGSGKDPLPLGNWKVTTFAYLPPFHYQPDLFWDVEDSKDDQMLPPGPNGPVGVAWLDITKEHYGIHGTPEPHTIGRAESHGCVRMTNWDVLRVSRMIKAGTKAVFQA